MTTRTPPTPVVPLDLDAIRAAKRQLEEQIKAAKVSQPERERLADEAKA